MANLNKPPTYFDRLQLHQSSYTWTGNTTFELHVEPGVYINCLTYRPDRRQDSFRFNQAEPIFLIFEV